jgi:hypothetical protein
MVLFPEDVCDRRTWHHFGRFGVHLMDGTWRKPRGFLLNRLLLFLEDRKMKSFTRESVQRGKSRQFRDQRTETAPMPAFVLGTK